MDSRSFELFNTGLKNKARNLRNNATLSEILLWNQLKGRQLLGYKFRRQVKIDNYIVDLYCRELKLIIEIDGFSHDFKIEHDQKREVFLNKLGLHILHFNDLDIKRDVGNVIQRIFDWIDGHASASPTPTPPKRGLTTKFPN